MLLYHRVARAGEDPLALRVSPQHFAEQLEVLGTRRSPSPLEEIVAGEAPRSAVAITIDDGYADVVDAALPALEARRRAAPRSSSAPATSRSGKAFWWDAIARLLRLAPDDAGPLELAIGGETRAWPARDAGEREFAFAVPRDAGCTPSGPS